MPGCAECVPVWNAWVSAHPLGTLKPQMTRDEVLAALAGHSVGVGVMIGKYPR